MPRKILIAGFDFGTSFSKVVIQDQMTKEKKVVSFGNQATWLLPSRIGFDGYRLLPPMSDGLEEFSVGYIKMLASYVINNNRNVEKLLCLPKPAIEKLKTNSEVERKQFVSLLLSWYFANVLSAIRRFISKDMRWHDFDPLAGDVWAVQMCVPTGLTQSNEALEKQMLSALQVAWALQEIPEADLAAAYDYKEWREKHLDAESAIREGNSGFDSKKHCFIYAEVAAGVQSLFRSPNARDGQYLTMDVGAGTIDMNAFFRRTGQWARDATDIPKGLDYYAVQIDPLGIARIKERSQNSPYSDSLSLHHEWSIDPLPEETLLNKVEKASFELFKKALIFQHNLGSPGRRTWDRETFCYIWGGGANHDGYSEAFIAGLKRGGIADPKVNRLPSPQDFVVPQGYDFGRFAVAYGLSFHSANLEKVKLPKELEPFSKTLEKLRKTDSSHSQSESVECSCRGLNPDCCKCNGSGVSQTHSATKVTPTVSKAGQSKAGDSKELPRNTYKRERRPISGSENSTNQRSTDRPISMEEVVIEALGDGPRHERLHAENSVYRFKELKYSLRQWERIKRIGYFGEKWKTLADINGHLDRCTPNTSKETSLVFEARAIIESHLGLRGTAHAWLSSGPSGPCLRLPAKDHRGPIIAFDVDPNFHHLQKLPRDRPILLKGRLVRRRGKIVIQIDSRKQGRRKRKPRR